ncbi:MAG: glycerol-3-phosphate 1-O-acyltransferase PlsY [Kiloniellaceae bacterium]
MPDPISWQYSGPYLLAALLGGYLLGAIPFGLVLARLGGLGDIRKVGSGNIGATNVLRAGRKDLAAATLLLDGGKGAAAVLIAGMWGPDPQLMAALGAVGGHLLPVWLKFKGGKGVATTLGVLLAIAWPVGLAACATWLAVAALLRYSSLSALASLAAAPLYAWLFMRDLQLVELSAILAVLVWARHHANIRRLLKGEEPKIGRKST